MLIPILSEDNHREVRSAGESVGGVGSVGLTPVAGSKVKPCAQPPSSDKLTDFQDHDFRLSWRAAFSAGLVALTTEASGKRFVYVNDFYRAARCTNDDGIDILYGVSARLVVEVTGLEGQAKLSLPIIAANVEIGVASASCKLNVRGYVGDLSGLVGSVTNLDVESYVELMTRMVEVKKKLSVDATNIVPVPLLVDLPDDTLAVEAERRYSVGLTFALSRIADDKSLAEAQRDPRWDQWSDEAQQAILDTYNDLAAEDSNRRPGSAAASFASKFLGPLRLRS